MGTGIYFPLSVLPFSLIIIFLFYMKKHISSKETWIFNTLIISNFFGLLIEILCTVASKIYSVLPLISKIIYKSYLLYLILWISTMAYYVYSMKKNEKKINKKNICLFVLYYIFICIILIILPIDVIIKNNFAIRYTTGLSVQFTYILSACALIFMIVCLIRNIKHLNNKKYVPVILFLIMGIVVAIVQNIYPQILLMTYLETIICVIMYFTIENPDLQMINELYKNKLLVEETYEDKSNFLFNMTQEVREPIFNINNIYNEVKDTKDINELQEGLSFINRSMRQLDFIINDVLDVATIDKEKVKFVNNRYNINNLYNDITIRVKQYIPKNVEFRCNINNNIPYLYGDSLKLKQVIMSILMNSVKQTEKGFIEFNIDTIEKYDVCRLIITINDSGGGISIDKINDILKTTTELSVDDIKDMEKMDINLHLCQKIIKLLGGNLMIKNTNNKGAKVMLTLDQRVYMEDDKVSLIDQYEYYINSSKQLLLVSQNKALIEKIKKRLRTENISITTSMYGKDAIDKIKYGKKYSLILMDDEMSGLSGYTTMQELKKLKGFHIPVIVMLGETKENIKEHYINDGFSDYVLVKDLNKELDKVIFKY